MNGKKYLYRKSTKNQDTVLILNKQLVLRDIDTASSWEQLGLVYKITPCMVFWKKRHIFIWIFSVLCDSVEGLTAPLDYSHHIFMKPEPSALMQAI